MKIKTEHVTRTPYVPSRKQESRCIQGMSIKKDATSSTNVFKDLSTNHLYLFISLCMFA